MEGCFLSDIFICTSGGAGGWFGVSLTQPVNTKLLLFLCGWGRSLSVWNPFVCSRFQGRFPQERNGIEEHLKFMSDVCQGESIDHLFSEVDSLVWGRFFRRCGASLVFSRRCFRDGKGLGGGFIP